MDSHWIVQCTAGTLLVRAGMALWQAGLVRAKNVSGLLLRHVIDICLVAVVFWAVGSMVLAWAPSGTTAGDLPPETQVRFIALCLLSSAIVIGGLSERARFFPSLLGSLLIAGVLLPLFYRFGEYHAADWPFRRFIDWGGAGAIHLSGAACALAGVLAVGPRGGKYNRDGSTNGIPGHSVPLASSGLLLMFVGWVFYLLFQSSDADLGLITLNVLLAAAGGGLGSLAVCRLRYGKIDIFLIYGGFIGALVAVSACADNVLPGTALLVGLIAGLILPALTVALDLIWKIDDPSGQIAAHGFGAIWGLLAAGLFVHTSGTWTANTLQKLRQLTTQVGIQLAGLLVILVISFGISLLAFQLVRRFARLRVSEAEEFDGLDLSEHDIGAYPDFQQTTIKSYHLREV